MFDGVGYQPQVAATNVANEEFGGGAVNFIDAYGASGMQRAIDVLAEIAEAMDIIKGLRVEEVDFDCGAHDIENLPAAATTMGAPNNTWDVSVSSASVQRLMPPETPWGREVARDEMEVHEE